MYRSLYLPFDNSPAAMGAIGIAATITPEFMQAHRPSQSSFPMMAGMRHG